MDVRCLIWVVKSLFFLWIVMVPVTWSMYGQSNCRLLIKGSSGLRHILFPSNLHLHYFSGQINMTKSYYLVYSPSKVSFEVVQWADPAHLHHCWHWCHRDFRDIQPTVKMQMRMAAARAPAKPLHLGTALTRTGLQSWEFGPSINVCLNRVIAGSVTEI